MGPFIMSDFQVGQHYTLKRVEDYPSSRAASLDPPRSCIACIRT